MDEKREAIRRRINTMLASDYRTNPAEVEVYHGAVSILTQLYGAGSGQLEELRKAGGNFGRMGLQAHSALVAASADLEAGLIGNLRQQFTGGVLADFVALARTALDDATPASDNVAAVLAAAAYEDTIRRLGREKAGILDRPKLEEVLQALRRAEVITDTQFTVSQRYLNFRNNALHSDFAKIERASTASALAFVEELLRAYFS